MTVRAILPLVAVLLTAAAAPAQDTKKELEKLQGEWTMVSLESRGEKVPEETVKQYRLTIKGDQWTVSSDMGTNEATFKIDPSKDPKTIDLTFKRADEAIPSRGIYKLEGDTLTLCRTVGDRERPKEFKTTADAGQLVVWKRTKK